VAVKVLDPGKATREKAQRFKHEILVTENFVHDVLVSGGKIRVLPMIDLHVSERAAPPPPRQTRGSRGGRECARRPAAAPVALGGATESMPATTDGPAAAGQRAGEACAIVTPAPVWLRPQQCRPLFAGALQHVGPGPRSQGHE
jgi:hypothetical protein